MRQGRRVLRRRPGEGAQITAALLGRLGSVRLGLLIIVVSFGCALVNGIVDALCLAAAIAAIGVPVPWAALLLAWGPGRLPRTPYGLDIVDVALIAAPHGTGLGPAAAVAAVLLYRVITFKIAVTLAWGRGQAIPWPHSVQSEFLSKIGV